MFGWNNKPPVVDQQIDWEPIIEWAKGANLRAAVHTPDIVEIESRPMHNVFIYNE